FISRHFDGQLAYAGDEQAPSSTLAEVTDKVRQDLDQREYGRAIRQAMAYADQLNQAFDAAQPWVMAKGWADADEARRQALQDVCSRALAGFQALSVMLAPVLPALSRRVAR